MQTACWRERSQAGRDAVEKSKWGLRALTAVMPESNRVARAVRAAAIDDLPAGESSAVVADCLADLPEGKRHALATALFGAEVPPQPTAAPKG